jgi:pimeloyl-ACP methyl ester carboxylesterase
MDGHDASRLDPQKTIIGLEWWCSLSLELAQRDMVATRRALFVDASGALLNTVSFGTGDRTLLAFGAWVFGWELWVGPMELLSRTWRTAGFDQRGSGSTVCAAAEISLAAMVSDVYTVMDALAIDRCVLGAESRGMIVAVKAVVGRPERFDGLVLVGGQPALAPLRSDRNVAQSDAD